MAQMMCSVVVPPGDVEAAGPKYGQASMVELRLNHSVNGYAGLAKSGCQAPAPPCQCRPCACDDCAPPDGALDTATDTRTDWRSDLFTASGVHTSVALCQQRACHDPWVAAVAGWCLLSTAPSGPLGRQGEDAYGSSGDGGFGLCRSRVWCLPVRFRPQRCLRRPGSAKIALLEKGQMPIYEPGLAELVMKNVKAGRCLSPWTLQDRWQGRMPSSLLWARAVAARRWACGSQLRLCRRARDRCFADGLLRHRDQVDGTVGTGDEVERIISEGAA